MIPSSSPALSARLARQFASAAALLLAAQFLTVASSAADAVTPAAPASTPAAPAPAAGPLTGGTNAVSSRALRQELDWLKAEKITSVSKREEDLFTTAAAVSIITSEEIRRSGARSIPEALRLAPGMSVAQMDANKWAVTARGFNSRFADKLLVLIDGRSVYTPSFSGVYWDTQDYLFEDIDRIEVIRGPGGTIWGANAVNGVINIITKSAKDTQGTYAGGAYGSEERGSAEARFGAKISENGFVRGYLKYRNTDSLANGFDGWDHTQGGVRADWTIGPTKLSLHGDAYYGNQRQQQVIAQRPFIPFSGPVIATNNESYHVSGQNVVARMETELGDENTLQIQAYYDRAERTALLMDGYRDTFDFDFQHRFALPLRQNFTYGFGYRYLPDHFRNTDPAWINWVPTERNWQLVTAFFQDEINLIEDRLRLTLGTKLEHNDFTGFEYQPSARLAFTPNNQQTFWSAVTRAVQVPGRNLDGIHGIVIPTTAALPLTVIGNGDRGVQATSVIAYELGHRWQPTKNFSLDSALFYNNYTRIVDGRGTVNLAPPGTYENTAFNQGTVDSYGFELSSKWHVTQSWRLTGTYSHLFVDFHGTANPIFGEGTDPRHQVSLRSSFDLPHGFELDLWGRYVDHLAQLSVSSYLDLDVRLAWHATRNVEFSITGQNLIAPRRFEYAADQYTKTTVNAVQRAVLAQVTLRF